MDDTPPLHPAVVALAALLGEWTGEGRGVYPTIDDFRYTEEARFTHVGKPFLAYAQRTWACDDRRPLHAETGYWRVPGGGRVELVLAHPTGVAEVEEGTLDTSDAGIRVLLTSTFVVHSASAKDVTALRRAIEIEGDVLRYRLDMGAVGQPLQLHLEAELHRIPTSRGSPPESGGDALENDTSG